ncbi:guanylate cyclase domain-containing protein [Haematococcus lacustris]|uniref:Guanylate cyclase domain-containing protein n=1 Tax=Haematococcus lacustris TaxID=44745 RepID=A0A699ZP99_HAELA|nr:guanylate cyclase domain-containing protein [Haematococcus lacustris]
MLDAAAAVPSLLGGSVQIRVVDTVNTASRMESTGLPGRLQVSEATYSLLPPERRALEWEQRGSIEVKGKGKMSTYLLRVDHGQPRTWHIVWPPSS